MPIFSSTIQDHVSNTMPQPYYRFDGSNDEINIANDTDLEIGLNDFSHLIRFRFNENGSWTVLCGSDQGSSKRWWMGRQAASEFFHFKTGASASERNLSITNDQRTLMEDGNWHTVIQSCDRDGTWAGYLDGVLLNSTTNHTDKSAETITTGQPVDIGTSNNLGYFDGEISTFQVWNKALTATEVKELYSGASVPYKYKGANQTDLVTNGDMSSATNWTEWGDNVTIGSATCSFDSSGGSARLSQTIGAVVAGKRYRLDYEVTAVGGAASFIVEDGNITTASVGLNASVGAHTVEFTSSTTSANPTRLMFRLTGGDATLSLDNAALTQIGAVAEYDGSGIASDKWLDKSGNDLHGTVSGATVENAPADADSGLVYEEGTWTVTARGSIDNDYGLSGTEEVCSYTRIGRTVHCQGAIQINSDNSADGDIRFSLPFTNANLTQLGGRAYGTAFLLNAGSTLAGKIVVHVGEGNAYFTLIHISDDGTSYPNLTDAELDGNWFLGFQITFTVE